jgi:hypothetical protein
MSPELVSEILRWGPAGVVLLLVLAGFLVTKGHADEIRGQRDRALMDGRESTSGVRELSAGVKDVAASQLLELDILKEIRDELRRRERTTT